MLDRTLKTTPTVPGPFLYKLSLSGFVIFLALTLLALVDFRRGFLFTDYVRSPYSAYHPGQLLILAIGAVGLLLCYQFLKSFEAREKITGDYVRALTFILLGLLVVDLLTYRSVPAARAVASGKLGADWLAGGRAGR